MGLRTPPKKETGFENDRAGASSLLKLLDKLYIGGLPGSQNKGMDEMKIPAKAALKPTPEEEAEAIDQPSNIMGSW